MSVTREMVFAEANRLAAAGITPTNRKLIQSLGGSSTTVAPFLRDWKATQALKSETSAEASDVPASVIESGNQAAVAIWQVCYAEARREVGVLTEQANQRVQNAERERDAVLLELDEAVGEFVAEQARGAALERENETLRTTVAAAASIQAGLKATAEQMARQIEAQTDELKRVHEEYESTRRAHANEVARITADFTRQLNNQAEALREAQTEAIGVRSKLESKETELQQALDREATARQEQAKAESESARVAMQRDQLEHAFGRQSDVEASLRSELADLRDQILNLTAERNSAVTDLAVARRDLSGTAATRDALQLELTNTRDRLTAMAAQGEGITGERDALRAQVASQLQVIAAISERAGQLPHHRG